MHEHVCMITDQKFVARTALCIEQAVVSWEFATSPFRCPILKIKMKRGVSAGAVNALSECLAIDRAYEPALLKLRDMVGHAVCSPSPPKNNNTPNQRTSLPACGRSSVAPAL